ncbi:TetR/AcrR family transcriptional regulator C-terminal domain-containing protein [Actinoplanes sp. LDG1-06]|uniref:TetR/AcrR family transcriptional regulator C-terminal domain-containing protein n=1 Tax=Paractinoplanes ovalisporus TaxID=2810368 RepID=A0ABS2AE76_9ACTN|nr:TetR/AcrR family transcriptional regulator C-terminal domain-containing protein [Actinoplanes ovalisporus]MBM2618065.1 TetR/AcrR family transcriptional regulator C-terminal domain-containing protein [Actinoplanes ovalisporus]
MRLTPALITEATLALGDREGEKAMSMRRIANELGCDPMAIYRHFPNREALLDAVADQIVDEVPPPAEGEPWDERIRAVLTGMRAVALRHPGIAGHVAARPPLGSRGRRYAGGLLAALAEAGLPPADVVRAFQALIAYSAAGLRMAVDAGERDARWHQVSGAMDDLPGDAMPVVGSEEQFEYGLRLLLNGIRVEGRLSTAEGCPQGTPR